MSSSNETVCFTCKQSIGEPPVLNEIREDEVCPACARRVLDSLPPALPGLGSQPLRRSERTTAALEEGPEFDLPGANFRPDDLPPEPA